MTFFPSSFQVATGDVRLSGSVVDVDPASGRATRITRLVARLPEELSVENEAESDADDAAV
jgi:calcineurin-like phosphoesterase